MTGCWIGFGLSSATAAAIYFVFGEPLPALVAEATAIALLGISYWAIYSEPPTDTAAMEMQPEAQPQVQQTVRQAALQGQRIQVVAR
jgi:hypothetical protein